MLVLSGIKVAKAPYADSLVIGGVCIAGIAASAWLLRRFVFRPTPALEKR